MVLFFLCHFLTEFHEGSSPTPLKHRVFLKVDLLEGVDLGRGSLPLTRLPCRDLILLWGGLILLLGYERAMFQADSEAPQRCGGPHPRDDRCGLLLRPRWTRTVCARHRISDPRGSSPLLRCCVWTARSRVWDGAAFLMLSCYFTTVSCAFSGARAVWFRGAQRLAGGGAVTDPGAGWRRALETVEMFGSHR